MAWRWEFDLLSVFVFNYFKTDRDRSLAKRYIILRTEPMR
jgi:hypothetical protein